jgi:hypothetical protein
MAQGQGASYNEFKRALLAGEIDLSGDSSGHVIKVCLVTAYTPNIDSDLTYTTTISGKECSGGVYVAGGATLGGKAVTTDTANDRGKFDGNDVLWSALQLAQTPSHAVMYDNTHAGKALIAYWEVTTPTNGGDYTIAWNSSGIFLLT